MPKCHSSLESLISVLNKCLFLSHLCALFFWFALCFSSGHSVCLSFNSVRRDLLQWYFICFHSTNIYCRAYYKIDIMSRTIKINMLLVFKRDLYKANFTNNDVQYRINFQKRGILIILKLFYLHWDSKRHQEWDLSEARVLRSAIHDKLILKATESPNLRNPGSSHQKDLFQISLQQMGPEWCSRLTAGAQGHIPVATERPILKTHTSTFCLGLKLPPQVASPWSGLFPPGVGTTVQGPHQRLKGK